MHIDSSIQGRSVPDFAKAYGISVPTAWRLIKRNDLIANKICGRTVILAAAEKEWRDNLPRLNDQAKSA
jgi:hypothetical protein